MPLSSCFEASQYYNLPSATGDAVILSPEPSASLNVASKCFSENKSRLPEAPPPVKWEAQTSLHESRKLSFDLTRYNSAPPSLISSFSDFQHEVTPHMPSQSNGSSNIEAILPGALRIGAVSNNALQKEVEILRRPLSADQNQLSDESWLNDRLIDQHFDSRDEACRLFLADFDHPAVAQSDYNYQFKTARYHFDSQKFKNMPSPKVTIQSNPTKAIKSSMKDETNGSLPTNSNMSGHVCSPVCCGHNHLNNDVVGFSEEAGTSSLSEAPEFGADLCSTGLSEDSISPEGCLMSILEGASSVRKRARDSDTFQASIGASPPDLHESAGRPTSLTRYVSLPVPLKPKNSTLLQGDPPHGSAPLRYRAKRGCATHPRSIAERVRRTRISERIRKLQELVPNMDRQSNIAEMLDDVVEYVKLLQSQVQELSESKAICEGICKCET